MDDIDILKTYLVMNKILPEMLKLDDKAQLVAVLGTAIDAWCKEKGEESIGVAYSLNAKIVEVNTIYGEMGS